MIGVRWKPYVKMLKRFGIDMAGLPSWARADDSKLTSSKPGNLVLKALNSSPVSAVTPKPNSIIMPVMERSTGMTGD